MRKVLLLVGCFLFCLSCKKSNNISSDLEEINDLLESRYKYLLSYPQDSLGFPRSASLNPEHIVKVSSKDWTSGFFVGNLWQLYKLTNNKEFMKKAVDWTPLMEKEKNNKGTHDMGFKILCSYGQGYQITKNNKYKDVIVKSAKTLITRFNDSVNSIRSWDFNKDTWSFPVIIDNMMNLELLFEATKITGDSLYHKIAVKHANTTLKNHFRENASTFHVVDYNPKNGAVRMKVTHQGYNNNSSWARGQAWAIYGFTMAYRYTKNINYLEQAKATAYFYLHHKNLPKDAIPFWDFDASNIPNEPRDVSAATITSSALVELYKYTKNSEYLNYSEKVIQTLKSKEYILNSNLKVPFILNHSTGNWPKNDEIDRPIVYADYYFLETLLRLNSI